MQELGRDVNSVLNNYIKYVKPSFDDYIFPTKRSADIIIPRGLENQGEQSKPIDGTSAYTLLFRF